MTVLLLLVLLTSSLPDPGMPSFVPLMGTVGFFVGGLAARLRGSPPDARPRWTGTGMWVGVGIGGATWMLLYAMDRL